jgi:hypothetical protein
VIENACETSRALAVKVAQICWMFQVTKNRFGENKYGFLAVFFLDSLPRQNRPEGRLNKFSTRKRTG